MVQGAVPGVAPDAAVPPEIGSPSEADQSVVMVKAVDPAFLDNECCMKFEVYGAVSANCL
jgi:hypothetical protein